MNNIRTIDHNHFKSLRKQGKRERESKMEKPTCGNPKKD